MPPRRRPEALREWDGAHVRPRSPNLAGFDRVARRHSRRSRAVGTDAKPVLALRHARGERDGPSLRPERELRFAVARGETVVAGAEPSRGEPAGPPHNGVTDGPGNAGLSGGA